jgi:peptide-methionine (S)-S-oxide reductase
VGYSGGTKENPTYRSLGDHAETLEIDFDPNVVSYEELLNVFWHSHDPFSRSWSRQYRSAIFYHGARQKSLAEKTRDREALSRKGRIHTMIVPATTFYRAEDYHQKYYLRMRSELVRQLKEIYRSEGEFVDSTLTARLNGHFAGYAPAADVEAEMAGLGLSEEQNKLLMDYLLPALRP